MNNKFKELTVVIIVLSSFIFSNCPDGTEVCLSLDSSNLNYDSSEDIAGFQFYHDGCASGASGGDAAAAGFIIAAGVLSPMDIASPETPAKPDLVIA